MTDQTPVTVPDEWLLAAAIDAYNDGRDQLTDFDGDHLEFLSDAIAAVIPLIRADERAGTASPGIHLRHGNRNPQNIYAVHPDGTETFAAVAMSCEHATLIIEAANQGLTPTRP